MALLAELIQMHKYAEGHETSPVVGLRHLSTGSKPCEDGDHPIREDPMAYHISPLAALRE
ncbi:MAG: hypothetical protein NPIRA04_20500 [Nitrospirales bacterium]|nr:MAG: hypothetical protein NPIRA04_20500 [Nitrospirales bacterium]